MHCGAAIALQGAAALSGWVLVMYITIPEQVGDLEMGLGGGGRKQLCRGEDRIGTGAVSDMHSMNSMVAVVLCNPQLG